MKSADQRHKYLLSGPHCDKTCLRGFCKGKIQTSLPSNRGLLEQWNFDWCILRYGPFQTANNKGADQTAWMRRLVCAFVGRNPPKTGFLSTRPSYNLRFEISWLFRCFWTGPDSKWNPDVLGKAKWQWYQFRHTFSWSPQFPASSSDSWHAAK